MLPDDPTGSPDYAGPVTPWPRPVPIRLEPEGRDELVVTTLGDVKTRLADGTFDPVADRVTTNDGRAIEEYYRRQLGITFYQPIDKSVFPLPPSGWCSWYYYYQEVTAEEVLANARWLAEHLAPYGARYVQIDDGWQGKGRGAGDNRDWTTVDARFREPGMAGLADSIHALGLEAGLWLAPHGQSNEELARGSGAFLFKADGSSASRTWVGDYLLDPTAGAAHTYLRDLFTRLSGWGYGYFKIDGQPLVLREYAAASEHMVGPVPERARQTAASGGADGEIVAAELYRSTLRTIRAAVGDDVYLLGCWGIPLPGLGILNGSRAGEDVVPGWEGFLTATEAAQRWNFLHNIAWYSDPDVILVRPPLSDGTARAWATLQGLSGQALMSSDRLPDLPDSRVELLRRIYPAVDIRPLDLFKPDNARKPIWDLKVSHLGRTYDVVAAFNYGSERAESRLIAWADLGLEANEAYHVYDFWQGIYLGAWRHGVFLTVPPADVRVVTLVPESQRPVLISTSRHITQGWVDLLDLRSAGSLARPTLSGRSRILAGDPYTLTVGFPRARSTWRLAAADVRSVEGTAPVSVTWTSRRGHATLTIESAVSQAVDWELRFEAAAGSPLPVASPSRLDVEQVGLSAAILRWSTEQHSQAGYRVELDGEPVGIAFEPSVRLRDLVPGRSQRIAIRSIWYDGSTAAAAAEARFTPALAALVHLTDVEPQVARQERGNPTRDRSPGGNPLSSGGVEFARGLGTRAPSELSYRIFGAFQRFQARVGIDDEVEPPQDAAVTFEVWGDGRRLWSSAPIRYGREPLAIDLDVAGVQELTLRALPVGAGGHADWLEPRLIAAPTQR